MQNTRTRIRYQHIYTPYTQILARFNENTMKRQTLGMTSLLGTQRVHRILQKAGLGILNIRMHLNETGKE